jgi:hypothetical protein
MMSYTSNFRDSNGKFGPIQICSALPFMSLHQVYFSITETDPVWERCDEEVVEYSHILSSKCLMATDLIAGYALKFHIKIQPPMHVDDINFSSGFSSIVGKDFLGNDTFVINELQGHSLFSEKKSFEIIAITNMITTRNEPLHLYPKFLHWENDDMSGIGSLCDRIRLMPPTLDVRLPPGGGENREIFSMHKAVLFAASPYFETKCQWPSDKQEGETMVLEVDDFNAEVWINAFNFMYENSIESKDPYILQCLCILADRYLVKDLFVYSLRMLYHFFTYRGDRHSLSYIMSTLKLVQKFFDTRSGASKAELQALRHTVLQLIKKYHLELFSNQQFVERYLAFVNEHGSLDTKHEGTFELLGYEDENEEATGIIFSPKRPRDY